MANSDAWQAIASVPGAIASFFGGGAPAPPDAGTPGAWFGQAFAPDAAAGVASGAGTAFAPDAAAGVASGVDTAALAGLGGGGGGSFSLGGGERGLPGAGGLPSVVSQFSGGGAAPGGAPVSAPMSVPSSGGIFAGGVESAPTSSTGTSSYNTGGAYGPQAGGDTMSGFKFDTPAGGQPQTPTPGWGDAAKGFMKDYGQMAGVGVSGGGLLASLLKGNQKMPGESELRTQAADLAAQGKTLRDYVTNGTLPPGVATSLHSAGEAAKATIRSQYASRGMTGSDAEARDLANVDTSIVTQGASIASNLLQQGAQESQLSSQLYTTIMNAATQEDASLGQAISGFAQSLVPRQNVFIGSGKP